MLSGSMRYMWHPQQDWCVVANKHDTMLCFQVLSVSEDSTCSVWNIDDDKQVCCHGKDRTSCCYPVQQVTLVFSTSITNVQLHGGQFCDDLGKKFIVSGYEESLIFCYTKQ